VIRPALQIHHTHGKANRAAGVYIMIVNNRVLLFTDATVIIDPTAEDLAEIACLAADYARQLGLVPRVALLSFSNFGSTPHPLSDKVRRAVELIKARCPDIEVDGEMQADTAVVPEIVEERYPFSKVKDANVLVFLHWKQPILPRLLAGWATPGDRPDPAGDGSACPRPSNRRRVRISSISLRWRDGCRKPGSVTVSQVFYQRKDAASKRAASSSFAQIQPGLFFNDTFSRHQRTFRNPVSSRGECILQRIDPEHTYPYIHGG
jgi:hypothetical protein